MEKEIVFLKKLIVVITMFFASIALVLGYYVYTYTIELKTENIKLLKKVEDVNLANESSLQKLLNRHTLKVSKLQCNNLEIQRKNNKVAMSVGVSEKGLWQHFFDERDSTRMALGIANDGSNKIRLYDDKGNPRWVTTVTKSTISKPQYLTAIFKEKEEIHAIFGVADSVSLLGFYNDKKPVALLGADENASMLSFFNNEKIVNTCGYNYKLKASFLQMSNTVNNQKYILQNGASGSHQFFYDKNGNYRLGQGIDNLQSSYFEQIKFGNQVNFSLNTDINGNFKTYSYKTLSDRLYDGASLFSTAKTFFDMLGKK